MLSHLVACQFVTDASIKQQARDEIERLKAGKTCRAGKKNATTAHLISSSPAPTVVYNHPISRTPSHTVLPNSNFASGSNLVPGGSATDISDDTTMRPVKKSATGKVLGAEPQVWCAAT